MTWAITNIEVDERVLIRHLESICSKIRIDRSRILLTGMSDGGTFALAMEISGNDFYPAIARFPALCLRWIYDARKENASCGCTALGIGFFPVVRACQDLQRPGADIKLKVMEALSHAYPTEADDTILNWFGINRMHRQIVSCTVATSLQRLLYSRCGEISEKMFY